MALSTRSSSTLGATRARQGRLGRNILWVLLISLTLVVLGLFAAWAFHAPQLASAPGPRASREAAAQFNAPPPHAVVRQNYETGGAYAPQNQGNPGQPDRSKSTTP